ncbi:MAG: MFS transporter, partial [Deltaproteobacteria bacterium]|nr:MFS transporter [Deltaproteobacteria bacterium]
MDGPTRARRLAVLGGLYLGQGIVYGFGGFILVPTLAAAGVSLATQTGILALAGVPWVLKLLWGPVLDRFGGLASGRARLFAAAAMMAMAMALATMASRAQLAGEPATVAWLWLLLNVALSLQDVATDALVIDQVPAQQRGVANGVLLGGHHLGAEGIGSLGLGMVVASQGLSSALWVQAGLMVLLAGLPLMLPAVPTSAPRRDAGGTDGERGRLGAGLRRVLMRPAALRVAVIAALVLAADVVTSAVSGDFWVNRLHWSVEALSSVLAPLLLVTNLLAYGLTTVVVDRVGRGRAAAMASVALGGLWIGFGLLPGLWATNAFVLGFVVAQALVTAVLYVGLHAALMNATEPRVRASHFAVLMALLNLPRVAMVPAAASLVAALGFSGLFVAAGA